MNFQELIPTFQSEPNESLKLKTWLFETIQPYVRGRILEMNSGQHSLASFFVENNIPVHISETNREARHKVREKYAEIDDVRSIQKIEFSHPNFENLYTEMHSVFRMIISLNLTKTDPFSKIELHNIKYVLKQNGYLVVIVPSFTTTYGEIDLTFDDWKKYDLRSLKQFLSGFVLLRAVSFSVITDIKDQFADHFGPSILTIARKS